MMRQLMLAMPSNNALSRDVAAILKGDKRSWIPENGVIGSAKRFLLPASIVVAIAIALFVVLEIADVWRGGVLTTSRHPAQLLVRDTTGRNTVGEHTPAHALPAESSTTSAAEDHAGVVPPLGTRPNAPLHRDGMKVPPSPTIARPARKDIVIDRPARRIIEKADRASLVEDQRNVAALPAPIATAVPASSSDTARSADQADPVTVIKGTATETATTTPQDARRRAAIDAIRDLRRQ